MRPVRDIFHNIYYATFNCRRPIKMSPVCQLEMRGLPGGCWGWRFLGAPAPCTVIARNSSITHNESAGRRSSARGPPTRRSARSGGSACLGKTLGRRRRDDTDADNAFDEAADGVGAGVSLENGYASTISVSKLVMEPTTSPRSGSDTSNVSRIGVAGRLNA